MTHGHSSGGRVTKEFRAWLSIIQRCTNPKHPAYYRYGGAGIGVSPEVLDDFRTFLADVGFAPSSAHSLDRIDNTRGYELGNMKWSTRKEQQNNTRTNVYLTLNGERMTLVQAAEKCGQSYDLLCTRRRYGWPIAMALLIPSDRGHRRHAV